MLTSRDIVTAGAFVAWQGRWIFVTGPTRGGESLCITRLGGHLEQGESPWEAVLREVQEEAAVQAELVTPPATYWCIHGSEQSLLRAPWGQDGPTPLVVVTGSRGMTPLYLARSLGSPIPSAETQGLLSLTPAEIGRIVNTPMTLQEHLDAGGVARLRPGFPTALPLEPFYHIRLLHRILTWHPELA